MVSHSPRFVLAISPMPASWRNQNCDRTQRQRQSRVRRLQILIKMGVRVDLERKQLHSRLRGPSEYWLASQYPRGIKSFISYNIGQKVTIECLLVRGMHRQQHRLAMPKAGVSVRGTPSNYATAHKLLEFSAYSQHWFLAVSFCSLRRRTKI